MLREYIQISQYEREMVELQKQGCTLKNREQIRLYTSLKICVMTFSLYSFSPKAKMLTIKT